MPTIDPAALRRLADLFDGRSVVPRWSRGTFEVLHAAYSVPLAEVKRHLERHGSLHRLVETLVADGRAQTVPAESFDPWTFADVDRRAAYEAVVRWVERRETSPALRPSGRPLSRPTGRSSGSGAPRGSSGGKASSRERASS